MFRKIMRWLIGIMVGVMGLLFLVAVISFTYIYFNQERIVKEVTDAIGDELNGEVRSSDFSFNIFKYFPATSINLKEFSARDTMYSKHKMELLHAENVFIKINIKDLLSSKLDIENITLENGNLYVFTDSTGYSNKYLLEKNSAAGANTFQTRFKQLVFKNFRFIYRDQPKQKFYNVFCEELKCDFHLEGEEKFTSVEANGIIKFLGFNISKGLWCRNADFKTTLKINYSPIKKVLEIPTSTIVLNKQSYQISSSINLADSGSIALTIGSNDVVFNDVLKLGTDKLVNRLSAINFKYPVNFEAQITAKLSYGSLPEVKVHFVTHKNNLNYKSNEFNSCNLIADYSNKLDTLLAPSDTNSFIAIKEFNSVWENIPVKAELILIENLIKPHISTTLSGNFPLKFVNDLVGAQLFIFSKGTASYVLSVTANPVESKLNALVKGTIIIQNGSALYGPRSMPFSNINGKITINNSDVNIEKLSCNSGSSQLVLKGEAPGLIDFINNKKQDAKLSWSISSPYINIKDFLPFLSERKSTGVVKQNKSSRFFTEGSKLDNFLNASVLDMKMEVAKIEFKNFIATNFSGNVKLIKNEWKLNNLNFNHADGNVRLSGILKEVNPNLFSVHADANMKLLNIKKVFTSFDNFGQTIITGKNIDGIFNAQSVISFEMDNKTEIKHNSLMGTVDLSITNGELKGFQPIGKLGRFIFPKRNFSDIKFSEISNNFSVNGNEIYFDRMKVNSSVLEMYLQGSYFLDGKTDMTIQIPVGNLKKRDWDELSENVVDKGAKGMNVFINATTDKNGDIKFKYDPLKRIKDKKSAGFSKFIDN